MTLFNVGDQVVSYFSYLEPGHEDQGVHGVVTQLSEHNSQTYISVKIDVGERGLSGHYNHASWSMEHWTLVQPVVTITEPSEDIYNDLI